MQTFDVSLHADVYPVEVLRALQRAWGHDVLLVGAVAVDVITHGLAGLRLGRATRDVDVAVAVSDVLGLDAWVRQQGGTPGLVARLYVNGIKVDVLPFGDLATDDVVWRDGEVLNVAGLSDAYASAMLVDFGSDLILRTPTLAAMVALKIVSWRERRYDTGKDAGDVARLLEASRSGVYDEALWHDDAALEANEFDPVAAGPWRVGRTIASTFGDGALDFVREGLTDENLELLVADARGALRDPMLQLGALRRGIG